MISPHFLALVPNTSCRGGYVFVIPHPTSSSFPTSPELCWALARIQVLTVVGQACLHQRHHVLPGTPRRQGSSYCSIIGYPKTRDRHRERRSLWRSRCGGSEWPVEGTTIPLRHRRRGGQSDSGAAMDAGEIPLHLPDPRPTLGHPLVVPVHRSSIRRHDRLLRFLYQ